MSKVVSKVPQRKCIGCRASTDKSLLHRFVARYISEEDATESHRGSCLLLWDEKKKMVGRGGYLCVTHLKDPKVRHPKGWERALKLPKGSLLASQIGDLIKQVGGTDKSTSLKEGVLEHQKNKVRVVRYGTNKNL